MKIAMVLIGNSYRAPYVEKYFDLVARSDEFTIIYWDREGKRDRGPWKSVSFDQRLSGGSNIGKLFGYFEYRRFLSERLCRENYDFVVVSPTNTALLLNRMLIDRFDGRYILDIRDYCHERLPCVKRMESALVRHAALSVISSKGYEAFLPSGGDYISVHNNRELDRGQIEKIKSSRKKGEPIRIGCIGSIVYHSAYKQMIDSFSDDDRFQLVFIGHGSKVLADYCKERGIRNVDIQGEFAPEDTVAQFSDIHIVNGIYGKNHPSLDYALSNKLYLGAALGLPILANKGTYMEKTVRDYGIGIGIDWTNPESRDILFDYYQALDFNVLDQKCQAFLHQVDLDNKRFEEAVGTLFRSKVEETDGR